MRLRVGLVGLGDNWKAIHRPALMALADRFEIKAICCEIAQRSEMVAREFSAEPMDGFRAMVEREDIDAVLALSSDWAGPLPVLAACEAGKAVFSSVALDISADQIDEVRQRVDRSGVAFMAELPRRFAPATVRLKELIATRLGRPQILFCHERLPVEAQSNKLRRGDYCPLTWRFLMELVDWNSYIIGRNPTSVFSAAVRHPDGDRESFYQMVNLEFASENPDDIPVMVQLSVGHYVPQRWQDALSFRRPASVQIRCERGIAFVDLPSSIIWFDDAGQHNESLEMERPVGERMLDHFYRCVTSLIRRSSDLNDSCRALNIVLAANESIRTGCRQQLKNEY